MNETKINQTPMFTIQNPSNKNTNHVILSFGTEAKTLKRAIMARTNNAVNQQVLVAINISAHGFDITVRDLNNNVVGSMFLRSSALSNFRFCPPHQNPSVRLVKVVNVAEISNNLVACHDEDDVTVCLDGFSRLSFLCENTSAEWFSVELLEPDAEVKMLPKSRSANFSKDSYQAQILG